jgi:plasmid stability protein
MRANAVKQYTIRNIPANVDRALRRRARETRRSFNQVVVEALVAGSGEADVPQQHHDLDFMIGSMSEAAAARVEAEVRAQRRIDPDLWK